MKFLLTGKPFYNLKLVFLAKAIGRSRLRYKYLERWPKCCTVSEVLGKNTRKKAANSPRPVYIKVSAITLKDLSKKKQNFSFIYNHRNEALGV